MSKKLVISVAVLVAVLGIATSVSLIFRSQLINWFCPTPTMLLRELDKKSRKWQSALDTAKKLVEQLGRDKETTLGQLRDLGIKSENDLSEKPKAQVLNRERININAHRWVCGKKIEVLDLAITNAELKKKDIIRRQMENIVGIAPNEITKALEELALTDKELDEIESSTPPDISLEEDMNPHVKPVVPPSPKNNRGKVLPAQDVIQKWTKTDGTTIEAKAVSFTPGIGVVFQQRDGTEIKVPMKELIKDDKQRVRIMFKKQ